MEGTKENINLQAFPEYRNLQSKYDKRIARLEKNNERRFREGVVAGYQRAVQHVTERQHDLEYLVLTMGRNLERLEYWRDEIETKQEVKHDRGDKSTETG